MASALWPCLEVVLRSRQPLRHIRQSPLNISKPLEIEASFQRTTNEMVYGESKSVMWSCNDVTWPRKVKRVTTIRSEPNLFENSWRCNSATIANYWPNLLWDSTVGYPSDSLASSSCLVNDVIHTIIFREINALTPVPYILLAMVDNGYLSSWWLQHDHGLTAVSNCTG